MSRKDPPAIPEWQWLPWSPAEPAEAAARRWLAPRLGLGEADIGLTRDAHGRPRLAPDHGADTSWSHSGDGLLLALGRGVVVGVDMEQARPRPRALELAQRYFAPSEAAWLRGQDGDGARTAAFLRLWCAKEALLKAHGRGLAFGLHKLAFAERAGALALEAADPALGAVADWHLQEFVPHPGYRAALAWKAAPTMGDG
jgi:4'-phosphopantetheinyl transferase